MPREKSRYREKRSSSYSSDDSYERKKSKSKHKRRSRSRDRSESSSHKRKRSPSRGRHRRRSYSRSVSRDRYESRKRRSTSRSKSKRSNRPSRERSHSSERSHSKSKYSKSKHKSRRRSPSSSDSDITEKPVLPKTLNLTDIETKVEKAIKAAEAAGLTMTKIPTYEYREVDVKEDMPTIHDRNLLEEINNDSFAPKTFMSSRNKKQQNIVIDLNNDTVKLPDTELSIAKDDTIIDFSAILSEEELKEMWIKKLYQYRKKMLKGEI
ncbi:unnamed protein product [Plutella xylostella]|uniref:(diamondback moth) hypothetical protein n=1 Tax=Plutella xylostella TaxID=51655 RepID=A0A8S4G2Q0_PLUXY|nr:unnamed protein product [Plutella xylostella]